jgi:replicative DNA helicase
MSLERKLLAKLTDPREIDKVWNMGLRAEAFEEPLANRVYEFMLEYWRTSQMTAAPTPMVIETQHPGFKLEPGVEETADWLAEALMTRFIVNRIQKIIEASATTCFADPLGTLRAMANASYFASESVAPRHSRSNLALNVDERRMRYAAAEEHGIGIPFGLDEFDTHTGGLLAGELCGVGGLSKTGKTFFLCHVAVAAMRAGYRPVIFSLEMTREEIEDRLDALLSGVSYDRLSKRTLDIPELRNLFTAQDTMTADCPILVEAPEEGERTVAALLSRTRHTGSDFVIIDQLSFMEETQRYPSEKQRQASILKQLKNEISNSSRGKLACLLAVQLKREANNRKSGLEITDFADAAEVERTCDLLLGLSRNKEGRLNKLMQFDILGSRRSDIASWQLFWDLIDASEIRISSRIIGGQSHSPTGGSRTLQQIVAAAQADAEKAAEVT